MNEEVRRDLQSRVACDVLFGESLAGLSTYRIGGAADAVVHVRAPEDVMKAMTFAHERRITCLPIGLGSNLLFDDAGFRGIILRVAKRMTELDAQRDATFAVGAGLPTPLLAKRTAAAGMSGVHRLVGVPGAVGGGVFMNAGAHGQEFRDVVRQVTYVDARGGSHTIRGRDIPWKYRSSGLDGVVVSVIVALTPGDPAVLKREVSAYLKRRREGTPFDQPCCGSVFRNPTETESVSVDLPRPVTAGRLVEAAGLKGFRIRGAVVSPMHANYIVNDEGARATDVRETISTMRGRVLERFGIELRPEVKMLDELGQEYTL